MKMNIGVFFGGQSVEHEVSIISAVQAMHSMDENQYNIIPVYISKTGEMYSGDVLRKIEEFKNIPALLEKCTQVALYRSGVQVELLYKKKKNFKAKTAIGIDFALPIVHGTNCEDGTIQGFFEAFGLPYGGCNVVSSAIGMDKTLFKNVMQANGLPVVDGVGFTSREWVEDKDKIAKEIEARFGYPVIVKPANLGSSVGIAKATDRTALCEKIDLAASFSPRLLVEKAVESLREINCSVLGDAAKCEASVCEEPVMSDEILSYTDKYMSNSASKGMSGLSRIIPARLSPEKTSEIQEISKKVFQTLDCCGVVRIDFLIDEADGDKVYINEINTIPGSLAFYLWKESGLEYRELLDRIIQLGMKRTRDRKNLMFTYDTNILQDGAFGAKGAKK